MYKHTVYKNQFMVAAIALMCIFVFIPLQKTQAIELGKCSCTTTGTKGGKAVKDPVKEQTMTVKIYKNLQVNSLKKNVHGLPIPQQATETVTVSLANNHQNKERVLKM